MISADHPRFCCTSDMSLTIYGKIFSGPLVHTNDPSGTVLLGVSCAYAEYVVRTFSIRCIRSKYAARRLVIRYAYASHTLNKKPRWALAYDNVCERMSNLQVTLMNLCITCSLRTPNL